MSFEPVKDPVLTVELEKPIQFLGETITRIAFREPTAGDVLRVGNPVTKFDFEDNSIAFDEKKAFAMVSRLSNLPIEGSLETMTSNDAVNCFYGIARFFIPGLRTRPAKTPSTSSPKPDEPPAS